MREELPDRFYGVSTNFAEADEISECCVEETRDEPTHHRGKFFTLPFPFQEELEVEPDAEVTVLDCLILPE